MFARALHRYSRITACLLAGLVFSAMPSYATAIIVGFEGLSDGPIPDGYGGINWGGNWFALTFEQYPYEPHSGTNSAYAIPFSGEYTLDFLEPIHFVGAFFALAPSNRVYFNLYSEGQLVHTSLIMRPCVDAGPGDPLCDSAEPGTNPPRFLPSGYYEQKVDQVGIVSFAHGFYVMDDLVYGTGPEDVVPEPSTWSLIVGGFSMFGLMRLNARRLRRRTAAAGPPR
jgi:hypothetical protein